MINDPEFEAAVRFETDGVNTTEKVLFFDSDNTVRACLFPFQYDDLLRSTREQLEKAGDLKAVVHVNAFREGSPTGYGHRTTVIEYLPDKSWNTIVWKPAPSVIEKRPDMHVVRITQDLFKDNEK
jgi:hypothetical protein